MRTHRENQSATHLLNSCWLYDREDSDISSLFSNMMNEWLEANIMEQLKHGLCMSDEIIWMRILNWPTPLTYHIMVSGMLCNNKEFKNSGWKKWMPVPVPEPTPKPTLTPMPEHTLEPTHSWINGAHYHEQRVYSAIWTYVKGVIAKQECMNYICNGTQARQHQPYNRIPPMILSWT